MKKIRFGVICTWPWGVKNAESEFISRVAIAAKNIDAEMVCITKEGFIVDGDFYKTDNRIDASALDFVISLHYEDCKLLDTFYYHALWNPPKIYLQYPAYHLYSKNIASNDDFLIYGDRGVTDHLKTLLSDHPRDLSGASSLVSSFPESVVIEPQISDSVLFYCGVNWERYLKIGLRHSNLFKLLDELSDVNLYGLKGAWDGYKSYKGSIPFDGLSLIKEINKCGVVLVLSSDFHYLAGSVSNRIYEACAGGAIAISDTNRFIVDNFGDSVLYIDYAPKYPEHMFAQIRDHLDWIKEHPDEALRKAQKAQKIFLRNFSLDIQLNKIISNHGKRKTVVAQALYCKEKNEVLALLFLDTDTFSDREKNILDFQIKNIENQKNVKIILAICCDKRIETDIVKVIKQTAADVRIFAFDFFDNFSNKKISRGEVFRQVTSSTPHDYLMMLDGSESMFSTHVTTLIRTLEDNPEAVAAYSDISLSCPDGSIYPQSVINCPENFYNCLYPSYYLYPSGMFLLEKKVETFLPVESERYLDSLLINTLLNITIFKHHAKIECSRLLTISKIQDIDIVFPAILNVSSQINFVQGLVQTEYEKWLAQFPTPRTFCSSSSLSGANSHLRRAIKRYFGRKLRITIMLQNLRLLFAWKKGKRESIRNKRYRYKQELLDDCRDNLL